MVSGRPAPGCHSAPASVPFAVAMVWSAVLKANRGAGFVDARVPRGRHPVSSPRSLAAWAARGHYGAGRPPCCPVFRLEGVQYGAEKFGGFDGLDGHRAFVGQEFVSGLGAVLVAAC